MSLNIAFFAAAWPPEYQRPNGILTYLAAVVPALQELGHRVTIVSPRANGTSYADELVAVDLSPRGFVDKLRRRLDRARFGELSLIRTRGRSIAAAVAEAHARHPIDVLEIEESFGYANTFPADFPVPIVHRLHGPCFIGAQKTAETNPKAYAARYDIEKKAVLGAPFLTAPTQAVFDRVEAEWGEMRGEHRVIHNPIGDIPPAGYWSADIADPNLILVVARFEKVKGGDVAIRAIANLMDERPALRALIIGPDGTYHDADGITRNQAEYIAHHAPAHIDRFELAGLMPRDDIPAHRVKAGITLVPSRDETFSYAVAEAAMQGCPLVATAVGGIPEVTEGDKAAILVPNEDVGAMTAALERLLDNPDQARALGDSARRSAERLNVHTIAPQLVDFYQRAIDSAPLGH